VRRRSATEARHAPPPEGEDAADLGAPLPRRFYARPAPALARDALGRVLVCDGPAGRVAGVIVETEAYDGERDPASHAYRGPTARNRVMYGAPGHAYVYIIYGMHVCLNLVAETPGHAAAVLVRALEPLAGLELMQRRRSGAAWERLARGPGNLGRALALTLGHNGADLTQRPPAAALRSPRGHRPAHWHPARSRAAVALLARRSSLCLGPASRRDAAHFPVDTPVSPSYYSRSVHRAPR